MSGNNVSAEIEDILGDIARNVKKVDKDSSESLRKFTIRVQELLDRLESLTKIMDYV